MKHNLLIMLNDPYFKLATLFLNSFIKNSDISKVNKIIINNIGLSNINKNLLKQKYTNTDSKTNINIEFYETNKKFGFSKMHSAEWLESLTYKTKSLLEIIKKENNLPIIMIDTDMLVLKDFSHFINSDYDIQVCKREFESARNDIQLSMKYIASFLIINKKNEKVVDFLKDWIAEIESMIKQKLKPAYETPSMCKMIEKYRNVLKIDELNEINISCDKKYVENETYIIHMKSVGKEEGANGNFENRVNNVKNFSKKEILKYLD